MKKSLDYALKTNTVLWFWDARYVVRLDKHVCFYFVAFIFMYAFVPVDFSCFHNCHYNLFPLCISKHPLQSNEMEQAILSRCLRPDLFIFSDEK